MINNKRRRRDLLFLISIFTLCLSYAQCQKRPPNYSQDDMPVTGFSCHEKIVGGYYADPETDCQMFHVCVHVPGVGIQDFRFLCPNDTSFDQEHQICDDWFNVDCELALYDNFDLYRIGVDNEIKKPATPKKPSVPNKGTPIPLGPSTTIKPWQTGAPRKPAYAPVNNGISDDEDYYKQNGNAVSDESKAPSDLLRGSHSSNFFSSKTKGREDLEDDYDVPKASVKQQDVNPNPPPAKKNKTFVRKLANKRPVTQKTTQPSFNYSPTPQVAQYNQTAFEANKVTSKSRGNVNYNTFTKPPQDYQRLPDTSRGPALYQKINNLTEETDYQKNKQDTSRTYDSNFSFRAQQQQPKQKYAQQKTTTVVAPTQAEVRLPSTEYLQNIASTYQQPATLINNQLQDTGKYRQSNDYDYSSQNNQAYDYTFQQFKQPSSTAPKYQTSAKYYEASSTPQYNYNTAYVQANTTAFDYYKYYQTSTSPTHQKAKNYYTTTTTSTSPKYDPYATFQRINEKYEEEEFLKTAPSSNLKPSDINSIYNQKKSAYVNATLKAAYSVESKPNQYQATPTTQKPNYYQSSTSSSQTNYYQAQNYYKQAAVTSSPQTQQNNYYKQATASPAQNNYYQQAVTSSPQKNYYQQATSSAPQNNYYQQSTSSPPPQNNYYQQATSTASPNNYYQQATSSVPQNNYYQQQTASSPSQNNYYQQTSSSQQYHQPAVTSSAAPQNNYYQQYSTSAPQNANYYQQQAGSSQNYNPATNNYDSSYISTSSQKPTYYQAKVTSTSKPIVAAKVAPVGGVVPVKPVDSQKSTSQKNSHDYDYAYYDNAGSSEYDQIDVVGEDFGKIQKVKSS